MTLDRNIDVMLVVVGVLVSGIGAYFAWQAVWKPHIKVRWMITRLASPTNKGQLSVEGGNLANPYLTRIEVAQLGRKDLTADAFNAPLKFDLAPARIKLIEYVRVGPSTVGGEMQRKLHSFEIKPHVLHRRNRLIFEIISDGVPDVQVDNPFHNVKFSAHEREPMKEETPSGMISFVLAILVAFGSVPFVYSWVFRESWETATFEENTHSLQIAWLGAAAQLFLSLVLALIFGLMEALAVTLIRHVRQKL